MAHGDLHNVTLNSPLKVYVMVENHEEIKYNSLLSLDAAWSTLWIDSAIYHPWFMLDCGKSISNPDLDEYEKLPNVVAYINSGQAIDLPIIEFCGGYFNFMGIRNS